MRLVTWNVNSLRARAGRLFELLDVHAPDVVCLQETKVAPEQVPHLELAAIGYHAVDHSVGRWNGVALLVPAEADTRSVQIGLPGEPEPDEARWVEAVVGGIRVVSVYVPNGRAPGTPPFLGKLAFLDAVRDRVEELAGRGPLVIAGDWNVAPDDRDVWDPAMFVTSTHVTPDERDRFAAIMAAGGLVDAYRAVEPAEDTAFTWWDYRAGAFRRNLGMRIDLVLVSAGLEVHSCAVDRAFRKVGEGGDAPSDHAPLVVELGQPRRPWSG